MRHTFLHFDTREQSADFFSETDVEKCLPPRLVGRRARTPDPIRALPEMEDPLSQSMHVSPPDCNALLPDCSETFPAGIFPSGIPRDTEAQRLAFNEMFPSRVSSFGPESNIPRVPPRVGAQTKPAPLVAESGRPGRAQLLAKRHAYWASTVVFSN